MPQRRLDVARVTIVAGDSLFWAGSAYAELNGLEKVHHNFPSLFARQERIRIASNIGSTAKLVFVAAVDLHSDRQGGLLQKAREAGPREPGVTIIDAVDYRDYYPEKWGVTGRDRDKDREEGDRGGEPRVSPSLAPRLSFLLGGIAAGIRHEAAGPTVELLVVAHHFELKDSLIELSNRGAKVVIAFYRSLMSPRWERFGLYREDSKIRFEDLDPYLEEITTLGERRPPTTASAVGSAVSQLF